MAKPYEGPRDQRWYREDMPDTEDQFGRKWLVTIEKATGDPTGVIMPVAWDDPLRTPQRYLRVPRVRGRPVPGKLEVDFANWIPHQKDAEADWKRLLYTHGREQYKGKFAEMTRTGEAEHDDLLRELTGPKPFPSVAVLNLAKAGDKRFLGLAPLDAEARIMLEIPEPDDLVAGVEIDPFASATTWAEFLKIGRALQPSLPMADISRRWQERKQAIAA